LPWAGLLLPRWGGNAKLRNFNTGASGWLVARRFHIEIAINEPA
jgi:hypothetical protein